MELNDIIIQNINELMNANNLSKKEFSKKIGLSRQGFYDVLNGKTKVSVKLLQDLSVIFDKPINSFFILKTENNHNIRFSLTENDVSHTANESVEEYKSINIKERLSNLIIELTLEKEDLKKEVERLKKENEQLKLLVK